MAAAPNGLHGVEGDIFLFLEKLLTGERPPGDAGPLGLMVIRFHAAGAPVAQGLRECLFGHADKDAVGMGLCLLRHQRRMHTSEKNRHTPAPKVICKTVSA
ncbi:hypothetical protein SDC9_93105 [bioreactor metagenome]|uniref:Uncharacterized protein n=1 Tax=bioreactor metagenome TaxID=1076179 RepID=A0A644ZZL2_9ZZZZ